MLRSVALVGFLAVQAGVFTLGPSLLAAEPPPFLKVMEDNFSGKKNIHRAVKKAVDADATVLTSFDHDERLIDSLLARFRPRRSDARAFALTSRVLLLHATDDTRLDVSLAALPFEARLIDRGSDWRFKKDVTIRTCSAEDLVVLKAFASREFLSSRTAELPGPVHPGHGLGAETRAGAGTRAHSTSKPCR